MKNCYIVEMPDKCIAIADLTRFGDMLPGTTTITRINVPEKYRGQGFGSQLLKQITDDADKDQVILSLEILPSGPLDYDQLRDWYVRYGFYQLHSIPGIYCRNPKEL